MKAFFITLGCKVNQYDTECIKRKLEKDGYEFSETLEDADIIILNSCAVTLKSEEKLRKQINRVKSKNKNAVVVLTGCVAQAIKDVEKKFFDVDIVVGNSNRREISKLISEFISYRKRVIKIEKFDLNKKRAPEMIVPFSEKTRAFIKIEDGCNNFCSYCIIPFARGPVRSENEDDIIFKIKKLAKEFYKEVVLVGINLCAYGSDTKTNLCSLIKKISEINGIERIRLGSLEPDRLSFDEIDILSKIPKLCPQFHISLQSGSYTILNKMKRNYTPQDFLNVVQYIREKFRNASITTDIMVGFPGETEQEFCESYELAKKISFYKMHVFPYSRRPRTEAYSMKDQVIERIKKERQKKMSALELDMRRHFVLNQICKEHKVLFERKDKDGFYRGYTENYIPFKIKTQKDISNKIIKIKPDDFFEDKKEIGLMIRGVYDDFIL